jgi:hypothetical protein
LIDNIIKNTIITASSKHDNNNNKRYCYGDSYSEERKVNLITEGLEPRYANVLGNVLKENAIAIVDFVLNINIEVHLSDNHKRNYINILNPIIKIICRDNIVLNSFIYIKYK